MILEQNPRNIKGAQALPYEFGRETYEVYSNPKNPFLGRILGGEIPPWNWMQNRLAPYSRK